MKKNKSQELSPEAKEAKRQERQAAKAAKFVELANARVNKALAVLGNIGRLGNKNNYVYDEQSASKVINALKHGVGMVERAFAPNAVNKQAFDLFSEE